MLAGIIMMAAATVGGEWVDGAVRFETGNDAANRIVAAGSSGAYPSKVAEVYENLRHTGNKAVAKNNWQLLYGQVQQAASNRCDRTVTDDAFLGACWWLFEARMMCEIEHANLGRLNFDPEYVQMNIEAFKLILEQYIENGMLAKPLRGKPVQSAFAVYLGLVDGAALAVTCRDLKNALEAKPSPSMGAFEWKMALDALSQNGMAEAAYGLLLKHPDGIDSGAALSWLWRTAAGIASDPTNPGFRNVIMAPRPDRRLGFVKAEYKSVAGVIKSAWRYEGKKWIWDFTVPRNSTAAVTLPGQSLTRHYDGGDHHIELDIGQ